jgi:hypothetical protein
LIDLDIVTPYFRSREVDEVLIARGVDVVAPSNVARHLDTPAITPQVLGAMQQDDRWIILDVGGDEQGARALGQYSATLRRQGYVMYLVVNPYRPFTADTEGICEAIAQIERTSRLLVTGLVSNPNLLGGTATGHLRDGIAVVELAGRQLGMPVVFTTVERSLLDAAKGILPPEMPILPLERFFVMPWAESDEPG